MLNYTGKESTIITYPILLGGGVANIGVLLFLKNPWLHKKPLIDYDICLILLPNVLLGTSLGVLMNT
jgi:hypothetical protein